MNIPQLLTTARIAVDVEARSKKRALELVAEALAADTSALGQGAVFTSLIGRERLGSTAVGHGVALPHGRAEGITGCQGAFIRLKDPVDFEADDGDPVDLVFGLLVPTVCGDEHLAALSAIAQCFDDGNLRESLRAAKDADEVLRLMSDHQCG